MQIVKRRSLWCTWHTIVPNALSRKQYAGFQTLLLRFTFQYFIDSYRGRHQKSWTAALAPRSLPKAIPHYLEEWRRIDLILGTSFGRATRSFGRDMGTEPEIRQDQMQSRSTCKRIGRVTNPPGRALSNILAQEFWRPGLLVPTSVHYSK